jgi:hypothetical protein
VIRDAERLLKELRRAHGAIRDAVITACERQAMETLSAPIGDDDAGGDTIFALDRISEDTLLEELVPIARVWTFVLVAEGLSGGGRVVLPRGRSERDAELTIIVDPIDGTRGLMYQKRPAWILTGVAPTGAGSPATLAGIALALQTEIPLVKQHLSDALWVVNGVVGGERLNRLTGERTPLVPRPSRAETIVQGFGGIARFFPGGREMLAAIDDAVAARVAGAAPAGRALAFEDQYISTGGQLYELMMGHDRWIADIRPLAGTATRGLCCHPYDLCTESIARAAGVLITDERGRPLSPPLDVTTDCSWMGFANQALRDRVLPALTAELTSRGLV